MKAAHVAVSTTAAAIFAEAMAAPAVQVRHFSRHLVSLSVIAHPSGRTPVGLHVRMHAC